MPSELFHQQYDDVLHENVQLRARVAALEEDVERLVCLADMVARSDSVTITSDDRVCARAHCGGQVIVGAGRTLSSALDAVMTPADGEQTDA